MEQRERDFLAWLREQLAVETKPVRIEAFKRWIARIEEREDPHGR